MDKRIPFIIFVLAVAIDAFNGFLQYTLFIENPIGVIFRGTLWIYLLLSIIRIIELKRLLIICFFIILIISIWCIGYDASLLHEINYLIRYTYPIFLFCYFRIHWRSYSLKRLFKYSTIYATLISTIIIVCFILGIGHSSYGDNYGWGTTGLFIAQNDLSLTVVCGVIVSCIYYHKYCQSFLSFLQVFIVGIGGVLIGTRVCFIVIPFILAVHGHYVFRRYGNTTQKFVLLLLLLFFLPFIGWLIYLALDSYALAKLTLESIGNARTYLIDFAKHYIDSFNDLSLLIGKGVTNLQHYVARGYSGVEYRMVEADLYEIIGSYGFVLGGFVLFFLFFYNL